MNKVKFSVLLSIYYKEKPEYFRECMESVYSQTVLPDEIVLMHVNVVKSVWLTLIGLFTS
ncbi:MAG: hypothetical protein V8Q12_10395 [Agathobacter rectalis]